MAGDFGAVNGEKAGFEEEMRESDVLSVDKILENVRDPTVDAVSIRQVWNDTLTYVGSLLCGMYTATLWSNSLPYTPFAGRIQPVFRFGPFSFITMCSISALLAA